MKNKKRKKKLYGLLFSGPSNPRTAGTLYLPRSPAQARSSAQLQSRRSQDRIFRASSSGRSQSRRRPLDGVQRRRGSPSLGGGVGGSPSRLSPVASRLRLRPPRTGRRPWVRTSLSPSRLCCNVGARPAAQGGRALAPPVSWLTIWIVRLF